MDANTLLQAGYALFGAGAAWGGARMALNGTRKRVESIDVKLDKHIESDNVVQIKLLEGQATLLERTKAPRSRRRAG